MRFRLNFHSIRFRTWMYFLVFAAALMVLIWFMQVYMLDHHYAGTKRKLTVQAATMVAANYHKGEKTTETALKDVIENIQSVANSDDLYFRIDEGNKTIYPTSPDIRYQDDIREAQRHLSRDSDGNVPLDRRSTASTKRDESTSTNYLTYGLYLDTGRDIIMYTVAPLSPLSSTLIILQSQLVLVMIIALGLAFVLALFMSSRITKPITSITKSAARLANGEYGIVFPTSRKQYSEIRNLSRTLTKASRELEKSVNLQKDLLANVSHDIRTPLTMIKSYAEMIRDLSGDIPEKRNKHLKVIIDEADRLSVLVTDMLALSRMQAGTLELKIDPFDIKEAILAVLQPYRILEKNEGYDISFLCNDNYIVVGDEEKIKQVVSNLLTNAIKYAGEDKKVIINVRRWGRCIHFEIIDHGVGIKPEELEHIWDRYYKASSHHVRKARGSGLGLSIVKEILNLHHAKFGVESKVGKGSTFWFELEVLEDPRPEPPKRLRNRHVRYGARGADRHSRSKSSS